MILYGEEHAQTHSLRRTSKKGTPFVGRCTTCGQGGLTMADMNAPCNTYQPEDGPQVLDIYGDDEL